MFSLFNDKLCIQSRNLYCVEGDDEVSNMETLESILLQGIYPGQVIRIDWGQG